MEDKIYEVIATKGYSDVVTFYTLEEAIKCCNEWAEETGEAFSIVEVTRKSVYSR